MSCGWSQPSGPFAPCAAVCLRSSLDLPPASARPLALTYAGVAATLTVTFLVLQLCAFWFCAQPWPSHRLAMSGWGWYSSQPTWDWGHGKQQPTKAEAARGGWPTWKQAQGWGDDGVACDDYQVVTPAKVEEVKMEEAKTTDMEVDETNGKAQGSSEGSGKGCGKGSDQKAKAGGKSYPCAECGALHHHRDMILSKRAKHGQMKEVPPEKLPDGDKEYIPKQEVKFLKICAQCELQERRAAGERNVTLADVKKDIHRQNRSKEWNARGMFYHQACQEVDVSGLSRSEAKQKKTERCKELATEFLALLQKDDLMGVFSEAGERMREAMKQWKIIDNLVMQLDHTSAGPDAEALCQKLKEAEARWDELHGYKTFDDKGELQYRFIKAQDYDDRVSENISRFYVCPHCGTYFFSRFWVKRFKRWYCELDAAKWCQLADAADVERLKVAWGSDTSTWPKVGCGKLYRPFADGPGLVMEYKNNRGEWKAFRAEIMPEILDDCIKRKQVEFNKASNCITPEEVYDMIPRTYPKANPVPMAGFEAFPGLGRFDFRKWQEDNEPVMTTEGWCRLAMKIASKDPVNLEGIFNTAQDYLQKHGVGYKLTRASDAAGPLTSVVHVDAEF